MNKPRHEHESKASNKLFAHYPPPFLPGNGLMSGACGAFGGTIFPNAASSACPSSQPSSRAVSSKRRRCSAGVIARLKAADLGFGGLAPAFDSLR